MNGKTTQMMFLVISWLIVSAVANASPYPPDYCNARAEFMTHEHAAVAVVRSACGSTKYLIGYKSFGQFRGKNQISTIVKVRCTGSSSDTPDQGVILGAAWDNSGALMSVPLNEYHSVFSVCGMTQPAEVALAFYADGQWDSRFGDNYHINFKEPKASYKSDNTMIGDGEIPADVWNFINAQMAKRYDH